MFVEFEHADQTLRCYVARPTSGQDAPLVIVAHAWKGQSQFERDKADRLAELGYVAVAYDLYGDGTLAETADEARALMVPFASDRERLRTRFRFLVEACQSLDGIDVRRTAAIGFCFGGMCVLELARSGADLSGVVSFHGLLGRSDLDTQSINARVLVLHGWDDPMAPPDHVTALAEELTQANADWQIHGYGGVMHSFTHPTANDPTNGLRYDERADKRSWASMASFLAECFA